MLQTKDIAAATGFSMLSIAFSVPASAIDYDATVRAVSPRGSSVMECTRNILEEIASPNSDAIRYAPFVDGSKVLVCFHYAAAEGDRPLVTFKLPKPKEVDTSPKAKPMEAIMTGCLIGGMIDMAREPEARPGRYDCTVEPIPMPQP